MRRIIAAAFVSLDGVMQAPGGPTEDWTGGFAHGGWVWPHEDEATDDVLGALFGAPFDLLLGRKTYEIFAAYWPYVEPGNPIGESFDRVAKYVLTHSDDPLEWQNSHRLADIDAVRALKAGDGPDLLIQGSTTLYPQLFAASLIDRLTVMTFPIVLGSGKRLFGEGTPPFALTLLDHRTGKSGVRIATYAPGGEVPTGSFAQHEPSAREVARQERMQREG
jgi:dihydrofolate reductase